MTPPHPRKPKKPFFLLYSSELRTMRADVGKCLAYSRCSLNDAFHFLGLERGYALHSCPVWWQICSGEKPFRSRAVAPIDALCLNSWGHRADAALPEYSDCGYLHPMTFLVFVFLSHLLHIFLSNPNNPPKNKQSSVS